MLIKKYNIFNHFYSMIEDNEHAMEYLLSKNIQEFTNQKLIELKKERQKLKFELKKIRF